MSPYMARKLRGEFHGSPLFQFGVGDNGHTVVAERGERAALQRRLPVVADDYQPGIPALGSFFVSSQPNMMSFTASLSNRFGAWQNRVGWLALRWNRKSKLCS